VDRARGADVDALHLLATALDQPQDIGHWLRDNYRFHMSLFRIAEQPHTERILTSLLTLVQPYSLINVEHLGGRDKASKDHLEMVEAVRRRDSTGLAELFRSHLNDARSRLLTARVSEQEPDPLRLLRGLEP
jgi:DNA-binding GntR family transcriptional regulator